MAIEDIVAQTDRQAAEIRRLRSAIEAHQAARMDPQCGHSYINADARLWAALDPPRTGRPFYREEYEGNWTAGDDDE